MAEAVRIGKLARFSRLEVLNEILRIGLVPLYCHAELEIACGLAEAFHAGGARLMEFTNRGDDAHRTYSDMAVRLRESFPDLILGAGSIYGAPTAALYIASGANFIVGPVLSEEVARLCNRRKIAYIPGCATATGRDLNSASATSPLVTHTASQPANCFLRRR